MVNPSNFISRKQCFWAAHGKSKHNTMNQLYNKEHTANAHHPGKGRTTSSSVYTAFNKSSESAIYKRSVWKGIPQTVALMHKFSLCLCVNIVNLDRLDRFFRKCFSKYGHFRCVGVVIIIFWSICYSSFSKTFFFVNQVTFYDPW